MESSGGHSFGPKSFSSSSSPIKSEKPGSSVSLSTRRLSKVIKADLLRAVRLSDVLQGCGRYLSSSSSPGSGYELSVEVESIGAFLSHDWGTRSWKKIAALLCFYNSRSLLLANLLVCGVVIGLELGGLLGPVFRIEWTFVFAGYQVTAQWAHHTLVICPAVSFVLLFFWQRVREVLPGLGPRYMFLDKMCIHQTDEDIKAESILALAAFLKSSEHLVILWSPRYLTRLWCVYEIASWVHLGKNFTSTVTIIPVSLAVGFLLASLGMAVYFPVSVFIFRLPPLIYFIALVALLVPATIVPIHFLRRMVWELGHLKCQLKEFKVEQAECHCCTVGHSTGAHVSCDRELIYNALSEWFPDEDDCEGTVHLARFEEYVHDVVEPAVTGRLLGPWSRYVMCLLLLLPSLWVNTRVVSAIGPLAAMGGGASEILRVALEPCLNCFLIFPSVAMTALRLCSLSNRLGGEASLAIGLKGSACICFVVVGTLLTVLCLVGALAFTRARADAAPFFCAIAADSLFAVCMFCLPWRP